MTFLYYVHTCAFLFSLKKECVFPNDATVAQKTVILGSAILINAIFFEGQDDGGAAAS